MVSHASLFGTQKRQHITLLSFDSVVINSKDESAQVNIMEAETLVV